MSKHYLACTANELDEAVEKVLAGYKDVTPVTASAGDVRTGKKIVDATGAVKEGTLNTDDYYNNGYTAGVVEGNAVGYTRGHEAGYSEGYNKGLEEATPTLQSKEVIPSLVGQEITADTGFDGLLSVFIQAVPKSILDAEYQKGYDEAFELYKPYKQELEYIESTGTQYIRTAFAINGANINKYKVVADMAITGSSGWRVSGSGGTNPIFYVGISASNVFAYGNGTTDVQTSIAGNSSRHTWTLDCKNKIFSVDNLVNLSGISIGTFSGTRDFVISGYADSNTNAVCHAEKIYGYMFYENDVLVGHYIPVLDWDNVPCLYDKVSHKFYYNAGTGAFSYPVELPEGYTQVSYIQSSGTQHIDTGFKPNNNTRVYLDAEFINISNKDIFGARTSATSKNYAFLYVDGSGFRSDYNNVYSQLWNTTISGRQIIDKNKETTIVAGTSKSYTNSAFQCDYNLMLFTGNRAGDVSLKSSYKLYACKIYDNGTLVRDFIPCKNASGTAGLYDLANNKFYTNAGSGTFTYA